MEGHGEGPAGGGGFLARLLYHVYVLGMPVHRIVRLLDAEGLRVSEGTLTGAMQQVAALLAPLREAIVAHPTRGSCQHKAAHSRCVRLAGSYPPVRETTELASAGFK